MILEKINWGFKSKEEQLRMCVSRNSALIGFQGEYKKVFRPPLLKCEDLRCTS